MFAQIAAEVLRQLQRQLSRLSPQQYQMPLKVLNGSSIGAHTRHVLEFYQCLLDGMEAGLVSYDHRKRDLQIEREHGYALAVLDGLCTATLAAGAAPQPFMLEVKLTEGSPLQLPSHFDREAVYMVEHAVHHYALIRIGVQEHFPDVEIEPAFGVAYSTIEYRAQQPTETPGVCAS